MRYVYGCRSCGTTVDVSHPMSECDTRREVCPHCQGEMQRIPQPVRYYLDPAGVLLDHLDDGYRNWRQRQDHKRRTK